MQITIDLNTDNAAFDGSRVRRPLDGQGAEVLRILRAWIARGGKPGTLLDVNGNTVGRVTVREAR